jgi:hypothetical protein
MKNLLWSILGAISTIVMIYVLISDYRIVSILIDGGATGELQVRAAQKVERGRSSSGFTYSVYILSDKIVLENLAIRRSNALSVGYAYPILFDLNAAMKASKEGARLPEESYRIAKKGMSVFEVMQLTSGPFLFWLYPILVVFMGFGSLLFFRSYKRGEA